MLYAGVNRICLQHINKKETNIKLNITKMKVFTMVPRAHSSCPGTSPVAYFA